MQDGCPLAVSIYAMPKTGSTFLGRFGHDVAMRQRMCKVQQNTKEYICETISHVDCPRNGMHRKSVRRSRAFALPLPLRSGGALADWDCGVPQKVNQHLMTCSRSAAGGGSSIQPRLRCNTRTRHDMWLAANTWLAANSVCGLCSHSAEQEPLSGSGNFTMRQLLSAAGFIRGPLRQVSTPSRSPRATRPLDLQKQFIGSGPARRWV